MKKLSTLSLGNTRLTAAGVRRLIALPELRDLSLSCPTLGNETLETLKKDFPGVRLNIAGLTDKP